MYGHAQNNKQKLRDTSDERRKYHLNNFLRNKLFKGDGSANKPKKRHAILLGASLAQRRIFIILSVIEKKEGTNLKNPSSSCLTSRHH